MDHVYTGGGSPSRESAVGERNGFIVRREDQRTRREGGVLGERDVHCRIQLCVWDLKYRSALVELPQNCVVACPPWMQYELVRQGVPVEKTTATTVPGTRAYKFPVVDLLVWPPLLRPAKVPLLVQLAATALPLHTAMPRLSPISAEHIRRYTCDRFESSMGIR